MQFSDGSATSVDFEPFLRSTGILEAAKFLDRRQFRRFAIVGGNVVWGDYVPVEDLYLGCVS